MRSSEIDNAGHPTTSVADRAALQQHPAAARPGAACPRRRAAPHSPAARSRCGPSPPARSASRRRSARSATSVRADSHRDRCAATAARTRPPAARRRTSLTAGSQLHPGSHQFLCATQAAVTRKDGRDPDAGGDDHGSRHCARARSIGSRCRRPMRSRHLKAAGFQISLWPYPHVWPYMFKMTDGSPFERRAGAPGAELRDRPRRHRQIPERHGKAGLRPLPARTTRISARRSCATATIRTRRRRC